MGCHRCLPTIMSEGIAVVAAFLIISLGFTAAIPIIVDADNRTARERDREALELRWRSLVADRKNPDVAKWNSLETDFRTFAKKYDLHLEEHAKKAELADAVFLACPPRDDVRGYRGYLFPGPKGVCRYLCVPIVKE